MSAGHAEEPRNFAPKQPVQLNPPKNDPITGEELAQCNGLNADKPTYVAIKGKVFDVTGNASYGPDGPYKVFAGKDASRALGMSSVKEEDVRAEWQDLGDKEKQTLDDWMTFFSKRYNIVGQVST